MEMKEKKARVEDALHATRAAVEEGVVLVAVLLWFVYCKRLPTLKATTKIRTVGVELHCRAMEAPLRQIVRMLAVKALCCRQGQERER